MGRFVFFYMNRTTHMHMHMHMHMYMYMCMCMLHMLHAYKHGMS